MYQGPNDGSRDEYSSEAFLLGKRRIDSILRGDDAKKVEKTAGPTGEAPGPLSVVASARDTATKIREDPLVAIKRQEQEAYQAMMKDPAKRRQLLAQMGIAEEKPAKSKEKDDRHRSHRHHRSRRHRDDDDSDHGRHRRKRRDDSRDRSRSPRRYDEEQDYERRRKRRRSDSRDEPSNKRHYSDESDSDRRRYKSRRSDSKERRRYDSDQEYRTKEKGRDRGDRRLHEGAGRDSRGPRDSSRRRYNDDFSRGAGPEKRDYRDRRRHNGHNGTSHHNGSTSDKRDEEERARKLAAMQNDATDLDKAREARLSALAEKEQAAREADDQARSKSSKYGGRDFANRLHNSAGKESLADRIGRGRQGLQRDDD